MSEWQPYSGPWRRRGTFEPVKLDTIREAMRPLIGKSFMFDYAGTSDEDEAYPGQTRWMIAREHDAELTQDQIGRWMPAEDIRFV